MIGIRFATPAKQIFFFLANNVLRNPKAKPLLPKVHGGICDTLVHKDPNIPLEEWSPVKERVILSFRGSLKSTIEAADVVQIILCAPNVRIVLLSGKIGLAKSILRLARSYFESNEVLMMLFPQFCSDINQNSESFTTPARTDHSLRDPTIQVATFGSVKAGVHAEYLKLDDCTNEINQATPELVEKSIQKYDDLDPLLEPGGYIDFTGTRWAVDDLPEYIKTKGNEMEEETGRKHVLYFFQPVWNVKKIADEHPEWTDAQIQIAQRARDEREKKHRLNVDDVNLAWPEKLTPEFLWPKYRKNPRDFACLPAGAPVLMADWTEKSIEDLKVGDEIVGYTTEELIPAKVEAVHEEISEVWKVTTAAGRVLYCTPDHQWLRAEHRERYGPYGTLCVESRGGGKRKLGVPKVSVLTSVYTPSKPTTSEEQRDLDWLGGMFDGEGTVNGSLFLSQSKLKNPEVWHGLKDCLDRLGVTVKKYDHGKSGEECMWHLGGGRSLRIRLLQYARMYKKSRFVAALWKQNHNVAEIDGQHKIVSIESVGQQKVYNIQSSSGNYIAYGYATKNCQYLLNPESTTHGVFTQKLLARQTRSIDQMPMPHQSQIFINWDLAGVSGTGDFAVGIVGIWEFTGRLFIVDAVLEKFTSSTAICNAIIRLFKKWNPDYHRIESANGAELLQGELAMIAKKADLERAFYPNFEPPSNEANAKVTRISMLAGALEKDQIQFYLGIECLEDIFKQFEKFGGKPSSKYHDDAPDCIAQLYQRFKDEIGPKSIGYITPSDVVVDFQSEGPNIHDGEKDVDPHQDERLYADVEFLQRFTTSFPER